MVEKPELIRGKRVLVIEDGPTCTHGVMKYGAGVVAAKKYGAACPDTNDPLTEPNYGNTGCGPTALAMVMKYYSIETDPAQVGEQIDKIGGRICGTGTGGNAFTDVSKFAPSLIGESIGASTAMDRVREGKPVVFLTGPYKALGGCYESSAHYMVATGMDADGMVHINDPALCGIRGDVGTPGQIVLRDKAHGYGINQLAPSLFQQGAAFWYVHPKN
jgi:hypothetical protein